MPPGLPGTRPGLTPRTDPPGVSREPRAARRVACLLAAGCLYLALALSAPAEVPTAADWPMWRYDASRSGASPQRLPGTLHLRWQRQLPALEPAWPDQPAMQF